MDSGHDHQLAKSVLGSSHCHYKGVFTWTMAVAISWPGQQNRAVRATIKDNLHEQWPWPSTGQVSIREQPLLL